MMFDQQDSFFAGSDFTLSVRLAIPTTVIGWLIEFHGTGVQTASLFIKSTNNGGVTVVDASTGQFLINFVSEDTLSLPSETISWILKRADSGHSNVLASGSLYILPSP